MENENKAFFTSLEARVVASLMEKQLTTPNNYPLTLNSLVLACNQKSNREPVMSLTEGQVGHTVNVLKDRSLVNVDYGSRANHISHNVMNHLSLNKKKQAILTVLMMRTPQTLNDIKTRTQRMVDFNDLNDIHETLTEMIDADEPLVVCITKSAGSREDRYTHLLCGEITETIEKPKEQTTSNVGVKVNITQQLKLEQRVEALEKQVQELMELIK